MTLTLTYRGDTHVPIEVEGVTPCALREMSLGEIEKLTIYHGNREAALADFFSVEGDPSDEHHVWHGDLSGVHWLGTKMTSGRIDVPGNAGRHLGSEMRGGEIHVAGDAGDWVGGEMKGGRIDVRGSAGHLVGAAYRGSPRGMTGGTILVHGGVGNELGHTMRRGLIAIGGRCGDLPGFNMLAGTLLIFGECGIRPGAGMNRGTIGLFGDDPPKLLPSFTRGCTFRPPMMTLLSRQLRGWEFPVDDALSEQPLNLYHGDLVALGRGEVLMRATL